MNYEQWRRQYDARVKAFMDRTLPKLVKVTALNWFKVNYQKHRYYDGSSWQQWKMTRRQRLGIPPNYEALMSKRDNLFRSLNGIETKNGAIIRTAVKYAKIHNEGGDIKVTKKMIGFAWYKYYSSLKRNRKGQIQTNPKAEMYKGLALGFTKKYKHGGSIHIPKRPFLYKNDELARELRDVVKRALISALNK